MERRFRTSAAERHELTPGLRQPCRQLAIDLYSAALEAVDGRHLTAKYLEHNVEGCWHVLAVGKAAPAMLQGAHDALGDALISGLVVTTADRAGIPMPAPVQILVGGHPIPDHASFRAGTAVIDFVAALSAEAPVLVLLSGGASSLMEVPAPGCTPDNLAAVNRWLLGSGLDIVKTNRVRRYCSAIKGGGLARLIGSRPALQLIISDVVSGSAADVGSGPCFSSGVATLDVFDCPDEIKRTLDCIDPVTQSERSIKSRIIADNQRAVEVIVGAASSRGLSLDIYSEVLCGDAETAGRALATSLCNASGDGFVAGGETTVVLPPNPGVGGRCQSLALAAACVLENDDGLLLAAGTDGRDGDSNAAGACVDGQTVQRARDLDFDPGMALRTANAGVLLAATGEALPAQPTGTNVADIVIGLTKSACHRMA